MLVGVLVLLGAWRVAFVATRDFLDLGYLEQRYVAVGQYIDRALPSNAVILAMQHSGSIRYYSWPSDDPIPRFSPGCRPLTIEWLLARGYRPYILLEDWEELHYRARMGTGNVVARLDIRVLAEIRRRR